VAARDEDAWEVAVLMFKGLECSIVHKEEQRFGRQVGALKTCW